MEVIKQKRFSPLSVQQQVVLIFAGLQGYLDEIPIEKIQTIKQTLISLSAPGSKYLKIDSNQKVPVEELRKFIIQNI